jgi:hypothetical protein
MSRQVLLDTGPLVAFINPRDNFHGWAVTEWAARRKLSFFVLFNIPKTYQYLDFTYTI